MFPVMGWGAILTGARAVWRWFTGSKAGRCILIVATVAAAVAISYLAGRAKG